MIDVFYWFWDKLIIMLVNFSLLFILNISSNTDRSETNNLLLVELCSVFKGSFSITVLHFKNWKTTCRKKFHLCPLTLETAWSSLTNKSEMGMNSPYCGDNLWIRHAVVTIYFLWKSRMCFISNISLGSSALWLSQDLELGYPNWPLRTRVTLDITRTGIGGAAY